MKKLKALKRALGVLLVGLIGVNSIGFLAVAEDIDYSSHFTYEVTDSVAKITSFNNDISEVIMPDEVIINGVTYKIDEGTLTVKKGLFTNSNIENIIYPETYLSLGGDQMFYKSNLKNILFKNKVTFNINKATFYGAEKLEEMYIYAQSITYDSASLLFSKVPTTAVAYVKNDTVKATLEELKWPGTIVVDPTLGEESSGVNKTALESKIQEVETFLAGIDKSQYNNIEALETKLENARTVNNNSSATQDDVNNALLDLSTALTDVAKKTDKTALAAKISEIESFLSGIDKTKYVNVTLLEKALDSAKTLYNNDKATQEEVNSEIEALITARNDVKEIPQTVKGNLLKAVRNYENWHAELYADDYTASSLSSANALYTRANNMLLGKGTTILATQNEIDQMTDEMNDFKNLLVKNDSSEQKAELESLIAVAEKTENENYSSESWNALQTAILSAKETALTNDKLRSEYNAEKENLQKAIDELTTKIDIKEEAGEPFAKLYTGGKEVTTADFTADENTAGTSKIRITFDCAVDVSFNPYSSIEIKATISGTENYMKFTGTDNSYTTEAKGCTVDLPLNSAIKSGDSIKIFASTYSWETAADYVFAITKIEFIDDTGTVLKTITDRTIALDELKTAIAEAEKIEASNYTEDSFAELTNAITAAKDLPEDSAKTDIETAKTTLENAVAGLIENTENSSSEPESKPDSESSSETESKPKSESSSDTESKPDSLSKTDDSSSTESNSSSSKTDSGSANSNSNSTAKGTNPAGSNPNTGAKSAAVAGVLIIAAIGVIASRKK